MLLIKSGALFHCFSILRNWISTTMPLTKYELKALIYYALRIHLFNLFTKRIDEYIYS